MPHTPTPTSGPFSQAKLVCITSYLLVESLLFFLSAHTRTAHTLAPAANYPNYLGITSREIGVPPSYSRREIGYPPCEIAGDRLKC
jgi:hypothetical protein